MTPKNIRYGIRQTCWDRILTVLSANPAVEEVILFGSRAKGNFKPGSDIDLCLKGDLLTYKDIKKLNSDIENLNLPWKVDLLHYESIDDKAVTEHIDRVGIKLY